MNERNSTARLESADTGSESDNFKRLRLLAAKLAHAKALLRHRITHETQEACSILREIEEALGIVEVEATGEGQQSGQGVHGEDPPQA